MYNYAQHQPQSKVTVVQYQGKSNVEVTVNRVHPDSLHVTYPDGSTGFVRENYIVR